MKVLRVLLDNPSADVYGLELSRATGLKSGTLYPLLDRLEAADWVSSHWEDVDPASEGRPRRRFYSITGFGAHEARMLLLEHGVGGVAWV